MSRMQEMRAKFIAIIRWMSTSGAGVWHALVRWARHYLIDVIIVFFALSLTYAQNKYDASPPVIIQSAKVMINNI